MTHDRMTNVRWCPFYPGAVCSPLRCHPFWDGRFPFCDWPAVHWGHRDR